MQCLRDSKTVVPNKQTFALAAQVRRACCRVLHHVTSACLFLAVLRGLSALKNSAPMIRALRWVRPLCLKTPTQACASSGTHLDDAWAFLEEAEMAGVLSSSKELLDTRLVLLQVREDGRRASVVLDSKSPFRPHARNRFVWSFAAVNLDGWLAREGWENTVGRPSTRTAGFVSFPRVSMVRGSRVRRRCVGHLLERLVVQ